MGKFTFGRAKAFNFFSTIIINEARLLYRTAKNFEAMRDRLRDRMERELEVELRGL